MQNLNANPKTLQGIIFSPNADFGLDAAGKTSAVWRMRLGEVITTIPTIGFNVETVQHKNLEMTIWDVGGQDKIRKLQHVP